MADTERNKDTVHRMFDEVINKGQIDLVDELFDPEFQSQAPPGTMDREGFKDYVRMWLTGFPDARCEVYDLIAEGEQVAWGVRATGTHTGEFMGIPATGTSIDFDSLNIGEFRDGRAYRHKVLMDMPTLMGQLGVGPS